MFCNSFIIHLDFETPRISTNTTITRGEQLILHCHVASNRPVKYTWQKDGVPLTSNEANSSSLQIDSVTIKDEGYYTCQANMFERAEKRASYVLRVQCKFDNSKMAFNLYPCPLQSIFGIWGVVIVPVSGAGNAGFALNL